MVPNIPSPILADGSRYVPMPEDLFPVSELPKKLTPRPNGKRVHPKVALRWALKGAEGVVLEHVCQGRQKLTCWRWCVDFMRAVAAAKLARRQPAASASATATRSTSRTVVRGPRARRTGQILRDVGLEGGTGR
jgi:hypothetical protein